MPNICHVSDADFNTEVLQSSRPTLVDFWAPWCGPCRMVGPVIEKLAEAYDGKVKFCKLNVDENQQTAVRYSVMSIPTLLFFKDGKVADTVIGAMPEQALKPKVDALL